VSYTREFSSYPTADKVVKADADWNALLDHALEKPASYIIRKNGTYYEAINGSTGKVSYGGSGNAGGATGTDAKSVVQAASSAGGKLFFKGQTTYTFSDSVTLGTTPVVCEGEGDTTIFTLADNVNKPIFITAGGAVTSRKRHGFRNIKFKGNKTTNATNNHAIEAFLEQSWIEDCSFEEFGDYAVRTYGFSGAATACLNRIAHNNFIACLAIEFDNYAYDNLAFDNWIGDPSEALSMPDGDTIHAGYLTGGNRYIANHITETFHGSGIHLEGSGLDQILANFIQYCDYHGIWIDATTYAHAGDDWNYGGEIVGNHFDMNGQHTANTYSDIYLSGSAAPRYAYHWAVNGNTHNGTAAKYCYEEATGAFDNIITGNNWISGYVTAPCKLYANGVATSIASKNKGVDSHSQGILVTQGGWTVAPTTLVNATDGDWTNNTGIGTITYGGAYGNSAYMKIDMGYIADWKIAGRLRLGSNDAAGSYLNIRLYASDDDASYVETMYKDAWLSTYMIVGYGVGYFDCAGIVHGRYIRLNWCNTANPCTVSGGIMELKVTRFIE
jgi:hypothetical protein